MRKLSFEDVYSSESPLPYLSQMRSLGYNLQRSCGPSVDAAIRDILHRNHKKHRRIGCKVLDIGCSYGLNSAHCLFRESLNSWHLRLSALADQSKLEAIIASDQCAFSERLASRSVMFDGLDVSTNALKYAKRVGLIGNAFACNLEDQSVALPSDFPRYDLWVATGCVGYVTAVTFCRLLAVHRPDEVIFSCLRAISPLGIIDLFRAKEFRVSRINRRPILQRIFVPLAEDVSSPELFTAIHNGQRYWISDLYRCTTKT